MNRGEAMYKILHLISEENNLSEYKDYIDLEESYKEYVDGIELIRCGFEDDAYIRKGKVIGVHLPFYSDWLSYWKNNTDILTREFGSKEVWEGFYGGKDPLGLIKYFQKDMDYAHEISAKYVVFHVSNVSMRETIYREYDYSDEEVIEATIELVNLLFEGRNYSFEFLLENLPWPGLRFTDPNMAMKLLQGIKYENTGFILDTGHMMQNNLDLKNSEEGIDYIYDWFQDNIELLPYVRGIHLHESITGDLVREVLKNPFELKGDFYQKFAQIYEYVFQIDRHDVCVAKNTKKLIEFLDPEYLVYEFRSSHRQEREEKLKKQDQVLK